MELGRINRLVVLRQRDNGLYLGEINPTARDASRPYSDEGVGSAAARAEGPRREAVLLPKAEVPEGTAIGDELTVFLYKDSEDRLIATTHIPPLQVGSVAYLTISQVTDIGAFLDWGLMKDLLLPYAEQTHKVHEGEQVPVILYVDNSGRLAASMYIYSRLTAASGYKKNDKVRGMVYEVKKDLGAFVAVDGRYYGMIPKQELYDKIHVGDMVSARVLRVRDDGKLDLSGRKKAYAQMDEDAEKIIRVIKSYDGELPFTEKAEPEQIKAELGLSKAAFKRAIGRLYKEGRITLGRDSIFLKS